MQTILLLKSAFLCVSRFFGLSSFDTVTTLILSRLASFLPFFEVIPEILGKFLPKGEDITRVIRNLVCILLAHKELSGLTYGIRGADSRMSKTEDMENMIDVLSEWSETPTDYLKLATILLDKCKELGYVPQERRLNDYVPANTNS